MRLEEFLNCCNEKVNIMNGFEIAITYYAGSSTTYLSKELLDCAVNDIHISNREDDVIEVHLDKDLERL